MSTTTETPKVDSTSPPSYNKDQTVLPTPVSPAFGLVLLASGLVLPLQARLVLFLVLSGILVVLSEATRVQVGWVLQCLTVSGRGAYTTGVARLRSIWRFLFGSDKYAALVDEIDDDPDSSDVGKVSTRVERLAAYAFKAAKGERRYTVANRLIAEDWVRDYFSTLGMRPTDQVRHLMATVELCLLPTKYAVQAAEMAESAAIRQRRERVDLAK